MKRLNNSPLNGASNKRFDRMRSSMQQQQFHQQMQQNATLAGNQTFFPATPPTTMGMMQYPRHCVPQQPPPPPYFTQPPPMPHIWNFNVPPPNVVHPMSHCTRPPLPEHAVGNSSASTSTCTIEPTDDEGTHGVGSKKLKRKSTLVRYAAAKQWKREDALRAIALEEEYSNRSNKAPMLLLRFPDPDLNRDIISKYSPDIESVHFQQNSAPRYCFVHLKENADVEKNIETLSKIPFGVGFVQAELKREAPNTASNANPEFVDPYTLYIGNLPMTICRSTLNKHFSDAHRIDIGFSKRMKHTRYALARYKTIDDAIKEFKQSVNTLIESRSIIVRFLRQKNTTGADALAKKDALSTPNEVQNAEIVAAADIADKQAHTINSPIPSATKTQTNNAVNMPPPKPAATTAAGNLSAAFDSPRSIEEPDNMEIDSKENVLSDAAKWRQSLQQQESEQPVKKDKTQQRRNSLEEMFGELERRDAVIANRLGSTNDAAQQVSNLAAHIKTEATPFEDDLSEEENPPNSLLGARYKDDSAQIKTEPEDDATAHKRDQAYREDFAYDEEFDMEPEEDDNENWTGPQPPKPTDSSLNNSAQNSAPTTKSEVWESIRQQELLASNEVKPIVEQLPAAAVNTAHANSATHAHAATPFNEHTTFMEKLYEQVRRDKETEKKKRPRDEMDELFAQMNSDSDEEDNFF